MAYDPWVERILRVVDFVQAHLDSEIDPEQLGEIAGFSRHHFHRVFRGMTGESVMGFVRRLRLERAAMRLKFSSEPITHVALGSGYTSHEAFTRAFKNRFGSSPSDYRQHEVGIPKNAIPISVRDEPLKHCLTLRYTGDYDGCDAAWRRLDALSRATGLDAYAHQGIGLVYDDPEVTAAEHLRYDAALVMNRTDIPVGYPPELQHRTIPAGRYAVARYEGPYDELLEVYVTLLGQWMPFRRVELFDEPVVEIYLNRPDEVPPEKLVTEVCVRIQ